MREFTVDVEREVDGRWIGEVTNLPGVLCYGATRDEAVAKARALALQVLADRLGHGEDIVPVGANWLADAQRRYQEIKDRSAQTIRSEEVFAELAARRQK